MSRPQRKDSHWQTLWLIIGPRLPLTEINIDDYIFIGPLNDEDVVRLNAGGNLQPNLSVSSGFSVIRYAPRDDVESRYKLQIDVEAESEGEAEDKAKSVADKLLVSLTLNGPGARYYATLKKLKKLDADRETSGFSAVSTIVPLGPPDPALADEIKKSAELMDLIEGDAVAQNAYIHLLTAWSLQGISHEKILTRSIIQHYILAIEAVVNGLMTKVRLNYSDKIRLNERKFAAAFAKDLSKRADKPAAIREASTRLREISLINFLPSIDKIAPILALSDAQVAETKDLYRFRSKSLSHPGTATSEELNTWLGKGEYAQPGTADKLARIFLVSYCEQVGSAKHL